jgi:4'-phosphopantetheinyl transferase
VWIAAPPAVADPALLRRYAALESADERERRLRLHSEQDRLMRLVSVALVRTTLSRYADVPPEGWRFRRTAQGRPELVPDVCRPALRFSLSHARDLVACAVTLDREIGVDVECFDRRADVSAIARRYFARAEVQDLEARARERGRERFFEYWTLKEAYAKARGLGLALPFGRFSFQLEAGGPIRVAFDAELADDAEAWQFDLARPSSRHVLGLALRRGNVADLALRYASVVPCAD